MKRRLVAVCAGLCCALMGVLVAGGQHAQFFAIQAPSEVSITAWEADGTVIWSNAVTGFTATVVRADALVEDTAWVPHMEVAVEDGVVQRQIVVWQREELDPTDRSTLVLLSGGSFAMGDAMGDQAYMPFDELPVHTVTLDAFYIGRYPVTKGEWDEAFFWAITNGYDFVYDGTATEGMKPSDHPVGDVTWHDAVKWCNAKSEMEGLTPAYTIGVDVFRAGTGDPDCEWTANGYRLPTEAEWEYAARGGLAGKRFPWGDRISHLLANYEASCDGGGNFIFAYDDGPTCGLHPGYPLFFLGSPVNAFPPNGFGLYDMAGNLWNWCWDWYDADYYSVSPSANPLGPASGTERVMRGGEMSNYGPTGCRVSNRLPVAPDSRTFAVGLRVVRNAL